MPAGPGGCPAVDDVRLLLPVRDVATVSAPPPPPKRIPLAAGVMLPLKVLLPTEPNVTVFRPGVPKSRLFVSLAVMATTPDELGRCC